MREGCCGNAGSKNGLYESPSVPSDKVPILITNESVIPRAMLDKCKNLENLHRINSTAEGGVNLNNDLFPTPTLEDMTCCGGTLRHVERDEVWKKAEETLNAWKISMSTTPQIPVKLVHPSAKLPTKAYEDDGGWDLYSVEHVVIPPGERASINIGIAMAIPKGYVGLIWPRSGLSKKQGIDILAGVVDATYRGEVSAILLNTDKKHWEFFPGQKVAQILFQEVPKFELVVVDDLDTTERNTGGFGSSGA